MGKLEELAKLAARDSKGIRRMSLDSTPCSLGTAPATAKGENQLEQSSEFEFFGNDSKPCVKIYFSYGDKGTTEFHLEGDGTLKQYTNATLSEQEVREIKLNAGRDGRYAIAGKHYGQFEPNLYVNSNALGAAQALRYLSWAFRQAFGGLADGYKTTLQVKSVIEIVEFAISARGFDIKKDSSTVTVDGQEVAAPIYHLVNDKRYIDFYCDPFGRCRFLKNPTAAEFRRVAHEDYEDVMMYFRLEDISEWTSLGDDEFYEPLRIL